MASYGAKTTARSSQAAPTKSNSQTRQQPQKNDGGLFGGQPSPGRLSIPQKDLLVFFRQLSVILQSGVAIAQGMVLIAENMTNR